MHGIRVRVDRPEATATAAAAAAAAATSYPRTTDAYRYRHPRGNERPLFVPAPRLFPALDVVR